MKSLQWLLTGLLIACPLAVMACPPGEGNPPPPQPGIEDAPPPPHHTLRAPADAPPPPQMAPAPRPMAAPAGTTNFKMTREQCRRLSKTQGYSHDEFVARSIYCDKTYAANTFKDKDETEEDGSMGPGIVPIPPSGGTIAPSGGPLAPAYPAQ